MLTWTCPALWTGCAAEPTMAPVDLPADTASESEVTASMGQACRLHGDCARALTCLSEASAALSGFGPPGGMCTLACRLNEDCSRFDPMSLCVDLAPSGLPASYCAISCDPSAREPCGARPTLSCVHAMDALHREQHVCVPFCDGPGQCDSGAVCHGETNLCGAERDPGQRSLGEACDLSAVSDECADGFCAPMDLAAPGAPGVCTTGCRLAEDGLCNWPTQPDVTSAVCWPGPPETAGDSWVGMCVVGCRCNRDCQHPNAVCNPSPGESVADPPGFCFRHLDGKGGIVSCPDEP